jgi:hypothetical protein
MRRSMLALTVCGLLYGCGPAEDSEPIEGSPQPTAPVEAGETETGTVSEFKVYASSWAGSYVTFNSYGDHFVIQDTAADSAYAMVQILTPTYYECWNKGGAGTTKDCNFNFPENIEIRFRACTGKPNDLKCAGWKTANTQN